MTLIMPIMLLVPVMFALNFQRNFYFMVLYQNREFCLKITFILFNKQTPDMLLPTCLPAVSTGEEGESCGCAVSGPWGQFSRYPKYGITVSTYFQTSRQVTSVKRLITSETLKTYSSVNRNTVSFHSLWLYFGSQKHY